MNKKLYDLFVEFDKTAMAIETSEKAIEVAQLALEAARESNEKAKEAILDCEELTEALTTVGIAHGNSMFQINFGDADRCEPFLSIRDYQAPINSFMLNQATGDKDGK